MIRQTPSWEKATTCQHGKVYLGNRHGVFAVYRNNKTTLRGEAQLIIIAPVPIEGDGEGDVHKGEQTVTFPGALWLSTLYLFDALQQLVDLLLAQVADQLDKAIPRKHRVPAVVALNVASRGLVVRLLVAEASFDDLSDLLNVQKPVHIIVVTSVDLPQNLAIVSISEHGGADGRCAK